jgi:hypothetical protein
MEEIDWDKWRDERDKLRAEKEKNAIHVEFAEPQYGYWDGGSKKYGDFNIEGGEGHPGKGHYIRWGSFYLNFWFTSGSGRSWKEARSIAMRCIRRHINAPCTIS